eukprot:TRINITY_DN6598_c0_g1_i1.p1 TRINITY_DN6598_c0_g1~~TRINITY_DN6598_c0_g1_i1.p1  ORF type:complete len:121 (+),score=12.65 TRINITY_DN6598_c0_g1_i1:164-526(+)
MSCRLPSVSSQPGTPSSQQGGFARNASEPSLLATLAKPQPPKGLYRRSNSVYGGFYNDLCLPRERLHAPVIKTSNDYSKELLRCGFYKNKSLTTTLHTHEANNGSKRYMERSMDWMGGLT